MFAPIRPLGVPVMVSRILIAAVLTAITLSPSRGDDGPAARERKVKVALALELAKAAPAVAARSDCGECRTDLDAVRADVKKTGTPAVLFVGGCYGRGKEIKDSGAYMVRVPTYAGDDRGDARRIVVLGRKGESPAIHVWDTLPPDAPPDAVRKAVKDATDAAHPPKAEPAVKVNWYAATEPAAYLSYGVCATGNCPKR